jgi:hypothetical protein
MRYRFHRRDLLHTEIAKNVSLYENSSMNGWIWAIKRPKKALANQQKVYLAVC